jgi:Flp pilus assembly protein TadD
MRCRSDRGYLALFVMGCILSACVSRPGLQQPSFSADAKVRVAQAAEKSGDYALAESMYAAAADADPKDADVQLRYADALVRHGEIRRARDLLLRRMTTVSDRTKLQRGLGAIYAMAGEPAEAIVEFDKVLAADPGDVSALVNKAVALDLLGRHGEAQKLYRQVLKDSPDDPVVISDLALSTALAGQVREAEALLAPLENDDNVSKRIKTNLAIVHAANGDPDPWPAAPQEALASEQVKQLAEAVREGLKSGRPATP